MEMQVLCKFMFKTWVLFVGFKMFYVPGFFLFVTHAVIQNVDFHGFMNRNAAFTRLARETKDIFLSVIDSRKIEKSMSF